MSLFENAKWIWHCDDAKNDEYADFSAELICKKGCSYTLNIASDSNYALYINGELAEFGQYADYPHYKVADAIDITKHLSIGENKLLFTIWYYGADTQTYTHGEAGLIFEIFENDISVLWSSADTLSRPSVGYVNHECRLISGQLGYTYHFDASVKSFEEFSASYEVVGISKDIRPRPIKKLVLGERIASNVCLSGYFKYDAPTGRPEVDMQRAFISQRYLCKVGQPMCEDGFILGDAQNESGVFFIVDLCEETSGFLDFDIELPQDATIHIGYGEHLIDGRCRTSVRNFSCVYNGVAGRNKFLNAFRRFGCRYIQFFIHAPYAKIYYAGLRPTLYPVTVKKYNSGNLLRDTIYSVCENTLLQSMHEHYEDCPWREQALYCMDSRNQMLCGYYAFDEYEFPRANLKLISQGQTADGLLSICYPCGTSLMIPSFSLIYFIQMYEYIKYSGDTSLALECYDTLCDILEHFLERKDKSGLYLSFGGKDFWNFYEWSEGLSGELRKDTAPRHEAALNAFLSLALENMANISDALDKADDSKRYREIQALLNSAICKHFYNKDTELFENCLEEPFGARCNVLTNSLCLLCGAAVNINKKKILRVLSSNGQADVGIRCIPNTISMNSFRFDALLFEDRKKYSSIILDELDRDYLFMLRSGATAFWETIEGAAAFDNAGSLCHGWSALPIYYYEILK